MSAASSNGPALRLPEQPWDAHVHVLSHPPDVTIKGHVRSLPHAPIEALQAMHAALGVSRAVLVQVGGDYDGFLKQIDAGEGRYAGVVHLHADASDALIDTLHRGGVRGCRFFWVDFLGVQTPANVFRSVVERVAKRGWHVLLHVQAKDLIAQESLFRAAPAPLVIDHLAHLGPGQALLEPAMDLILDLQRTRETYVKLASGDRWSRTGAPSYADLEPLYRRIIENDPSRVLWATDWPHVLYKDPENPGDPPPDDADLLALLFRVCRSQAEVDQILQHTPARLYR